MSAIVGGTASELGGGKFANGAVTGAFVMMYNEMAHEMSYEKLEKAYQTKLDMLKSHKLHSSALSAIEAGGSCATRMSNCINGAGYDLLDQAFATQGVGTVGDSNGNRYIMGAGNLARFLGVQSQKYLISDMASIAGKQGIIYFQNYHIDLYNGASMVGNGQVTSGYTNKNTYFMELK